MRSKRNPSILYSSVQYLTESIMNRRAKPTHPKCPISRCSTTTCATDSKAAYEIRGVGKICVRTVIEIVGFRSGLAAQHFVAREEERRTLARKNGRNRIYVGATGSTSALPSRLRVFNNVSRHSVQNIVVADCNATLDLLRGRKLELRERLFDSDELLWSEHRPPTA